MQSAYAGDLRIATYNVELSQRGPGLLYAAILRGDHPRVLATQAIILKVHPDILLLTGFDYDLGAAALTAYAEGLAAQGLTYPHLVALRPNTGMATGLDMDGDGRLGDAGDAQGWGRFAGADGMAILSRYPVLTEQVRDFSTMLWRDLPGAQLPEQGGTPFPSAGALAIQRLSTTGHWDVPIQLPDGAVVHLLALYATPPVFDGPEDRNGLRNHDEVAFWSAYLAGKLSYSAPHGRFVILGDTNLDPADGNGRGDAMRALLAHPLVQDPVPRSNGAASAAQGVGQTGDRALDTAAWPTPDAEKPGPGNLRVDYVLPSADWTISGAGVFWPAPGEADAAMVSGSDGSRHRLVWVDIAP